MRRSSVGPSRHAWSFPDNRNAGRCRGLSKHIVSATSIAADPKPMMADRRLLPLLIPLTLVVVCLTLAGGNDSCVKTDRDPSLRVRVVA